MRYETFTWAIYVQYTSYVDRTAAAALALVLVGLVLFLFAVENNVHGDQSEETSQSGGAQGANTPPVPLGRWKYPAIAFCSAVVLLALIIPMSVLLFWLIRGIIVGEQLRSA